ncbi:G2/mitotic-specific cyclin-B3-like [Watersipora subatra]|uniref:G2/mitotic-specific cyclin-B3-like n=1 Tax=Watersipora subatra TaxID=2589382 RepID=UPI00355C6CD3
MEPRRSQRTQSIRSNTLQSTHASQRVAANKRKVSVTEASDSQAHLSKRAAFGDITNRKISTLKKGSKVPTKKTLKTSSTESNERIISSQENSLSSQTSLTQSSQLSDKVHSLQSASLTDTRNSSLFNIAAPVSDHDTTELRYNDIDEENKTDTFQSPEYAQDIFNYYKSREVEFLVDDYMTRQTEVTPSMRAVLVDWLVEVQENFELNHETLYLATRLVDHYLMRRIVTKEALQLVGAAAVFIGSKFDERIPPMVDDFLYVCDDAYNRTEFVRMEKDILRTVDFNLGMPISYRFLRRFAKAGKKTMTVLTLSRYINETALMSYKVVPLKESLVAASCLRLAMFMAEPDSIWDDTLIYYSGYRDAELKETVLLLNSLLFNKNPALRTVEKKYSHHVFFEVACKPLVPSHMLYPETTSSITDISSTVAQAILV